MRNAVLLFLLVFTPVCFYAQAPIQGTVIDKDSRKPVSDVIVQYGATSRDYYNTDNNGKYTIPATSEDVIHFQCIGYRAKSIPRSTLASNPVVTLELNPVSLNPIVISPGDADALLDEAMENTKRKLLLDLHLGYLLHFLQTKTTDTLQNEIYMKYTTTLSEKDLKKNIKKERVPYVFNIIDIKRMQRTETPTSELYGAEYHASHLFTFGKSVNNETTRSFTSDSSLIILQIEPLEGRDGWARGEILINKDDMTIASMEIESIDSVLADQPYKRYMGKQIKIMRKVGRFSFKKVAGKYYMSDCYTFYRFRAIDEFGKEEEISYFCDVEFKGFVEKKQLRKRRLSGFCQELFYFPDSTTKEFWNQDFDQDLETYYQGSGIAGNKKKPVGKKILNVAMFAVPVALIAILVK
ncbi:hypothetical protein D0T84_12440 [Dysgonomonas sp. 521]|uniref:carboxypeptidase-like regulatory domain-containing protein n=1 Tax=Dysgonomonas sp. 521 TaxID=2302932 RepID=UPI0013D267B8|nr:carboxypeptidase-like regulatory domain-containing protein [Dysgonomonas sp. 521]NDV95715.1 hypothetical protein [Dysgonomonas sp. 521]